MAMTNEQLLEDLKQYIDGRLAQTETRLDARIDGVETKLIKHDQEFEDLNAKMDTIMDATGEQIHDHERRITKLESQTA